MQQNFPPSYRRNRVFVSYSRNDNTKVENIVEELRSAGIEIWIDTSDIGVGRRWDHTIREEIINSKAVLYFVSPNSENSPNVANELDIVKEYNRSSEQKIEIYPIWIEGDYWENCAIVGFSRIMYYDLRGENYSSEFSKLIDKLEHLMGESPQEEDRPPQPNIENPRRTRYVPVKASLPLIMFIVGLLAGVIGTLLFNWLSLSQGSPVSNSVLVKTASDSGPGSLRQYVEHAKENTLIQLSSDLAGQEIDLTSGNLEIGQNLTIQGPADIEQPMDNCINNENSAQHYGCIINKGLDKFLKIKIGSSKGYRIHIQNTAHVIFRNILFSDTNTAKSGTNTAFLFNEGSIDLQYCWVSHNKSAYNGAGITNQRGAVSLLKSVFFQNTTSGGEAGAIYNLLGEVTLDRSYIWNNTSQNNGAGISSLDGSVHLSDSEVSQNTSQNSGGGIAILNGILTLDQGSAIESNFAADSGGGIALFGTNATITSSNVDQNSAQKYGAGILVVKNPDNNYVSSLVVNGVELDNPQAAHYIGQNEIVDQNKQQKTAENIRGIQVSWPNEKSDNTILYSDDPSITPPLGNPPEANPPTNNPNLLGIVNINHFCEIVGYSYGSFDSSIGSEDSLGITCSGFQNRTKPFPTKDVCNQIYGSYNSAIIDRVANYNDPTSLQCYKNASESHPFQKNVLDEYCRKLSQDGSPLYSEAELFGPDPHTAYDWKCQPIDSTRAGPVGISVTEACRDAYGEKAFDRLVNYSSENGWECRVFGA